MKILSAATLALALWSVGICQKMTDRELEGLKGTVKVVDETRQKVNQEGKPAEQITSQRVTTYDEAGNVLATDSSTGTRTSYFTLDRDKVSKSDRAAPPPPKVKLPPGTILVERKQPKDSRYDTKYKYKYDKNGRIAEIVSESQDGSPATRKKYSYDATGRCASLTTTGFNGGLEMKVSMTYADNGTETEAAVTTTMHTMGGFQSETTIIRYSDYKLDENGNWLARTETLLDKKGNVTSISRKVRQISYY